MTAATLTIADFLLARIAEDEAVASTAMDCEEPTGSTRWYVDGPAQVSGKFWVYATGEKFGHEPIAAHIARHDPARVLTECAAKRAIVELHGRPHECSTYRHGDVDSCTWCLDGDECSTLRALASVYADHADSDPRWVS